VLLTKLQRSYKCVLTTALQTRQPHFLTKILVYSILRSNKYSKISNSLIVGFASNRIVINYSIQCAILNIHTALQLNRQLSLNKVLS